MLRYLLVLCAFGWAASSAAAQADVRIEPVHLDGPRQLGAETQAAAIRDYLQSWQSFKAAFAQNQAALLDADFVGNAREKLSAAIEQQAALGIRTRYQDRAHDLRIVFYSPEGLSIELTDAVQYDVQVLDHGRPVATKTEHARYIVVLTPSEVRWRVRVFQATPE
ncbi:MAG TPA: hypothetical protein VMI06_08655 [Terriglobia bacterium]|nr:hypothetical protein [Terriglobia bacterium]